MRGLERAGQLRDGERVVPWFYRVLRNAAIDHLRRRDAGRRRLEALAAELPEAGPDPAAEAEICRCVVALAATLKPEYARAVRRVELEGVALADFAAEAGITPNNAGVRVFRAREALRKRVAAVCRTCATHGCLDCTCAGETEEGV